MSDEKMHSPFFPQAMWEDVLAMRGELMKHFPAREVQDLPLSDLQELYAALVREEVSKW